MADIPILYEDGEALIIDKPGGLPLDQPRTIFQAAAAADGDRIVVLDETHEQPRGVGGIHQSATAALAPAVSVLEIGGTLTQTGYAG